MTEDCIKCCYIFATLVFSSIYVIGTEYTPSEETRIDQYKDYEQYQDIFKAFNITKKYWLFGFNYQSPHTANKSCVFFKIDSLTSDGMNYSSNFIKYNNCKGHIDYIGEFYTGVLLSNNQPQKREIPNSLTARPKLGNWTMNYTLIYSNYKNCSLFRIPAMLNGSGCMALVTDLEQGMSRECERMFNNSCGKYHNLWKVPGTDCKNVHERITINCTSI